MEFPAVGAAPIVPDLTQVVAELLLFEIVQFVGGKVAVTNPSVNGNVAAVDATTFT